MSSVPADRKYSKTHEWFLREDHTVRMGITQFAADELTDITFVATPAVGKTVTAGKAFGEVESVKATSELFSAVSGEVVEVNTALADHPELVNQDPFGAGWLIRIKAEDLSLLDVLLDADAYQKLISQG